jgi:hypothetical protein
MTTRRTRVARGAADFEMLMRELGCDQRQLMKAFINFEASCPIYEELPRAKARKWLTAVSSTSRRLADLLEKDAQALFTSKRAGHPWASVVLQRLLMEAHSPDDPQSGMVAWARATWKPVKLIEDLRRIANAATDKRLFLFMRGDKRRQWHLHSLVGELAEIYEQHTGRKAKRSTENGKPGGPFFRIVKGAYSVLSVSKTDEAIALDIRAALKGRRSVRLLKRMVQNREAGN